MPCSFSGIGLLGVEVVEAGRVGTLSAGAEDSPPQAASVAASVAPATPTTAHLLSIGEDYFGWLAHPNTSDARRGGRQTFSRPGHYA